MSVTDRHNCQLIKILQYQIMTTPRNKILSEVQSVIYGKRKDALSPTDIHTLFQGPIDSEFNLILYRAFENKALNPDMAILQAISYATTVEYLIPVALCLRFGADPNMYVNAPTLGAIHILGYVYYVLGDKLQAVNPEVRNTIIMMLVIKGARPSHPMFSSNGGKVQRESQMRSESRSVLEWLNDQGYDHILDQVNVTDPAHLQKVLDPEALVQLSIYLDMPTLAARPFKPGDMPYAIQSHSHEVFNRIPVLHVQVNLDYKTLRDAVIYLNGTAYVRLLSQGQVPSYLLLNDIIADMVHYHNSDGAIAMRELQHMLVQSVASGSQLDQDQRTLMSSLGQNVVNSVMKEYNVPYWKKACKFPNSQAPVPTHLKRIAISLNIDPTMSKAAICQKISKLSEADKDALKEAAKRRQSMRLAAEMGTLNEFLNGQTPHITCRNRNVLPHDPLDYNDHDIAAYRDDQGAVWCFPSDTFASLLETGVNPHNQTALPQSFKIKLRYKLEVLRLLDIDADQGSIGLYSSRVPITFSQAIDDLTKPDAISERDSEGAWRHLLQLSAAAGVTVETLRSLSKEDMMAALRTIGYDVNLRPFSHSHALVTMAHIVRNANSDLRPKFFDALAAEPMLA